MDFRPQLHEKKVVMFHKVAREKEIDSYFKSHVIKKMQNEVLNKFTI